MGKIDIESYLKSLPMVAFSTSGKKLPLKTNDDLSEIKFSRISAKTPESSICNYVAIDTETTGLSSRSNIIEVAAVKFENFFPVEGFSTLCYTDSVPSVVTTITGITKDMLKGKPHFYQIIQDLQNFIGEDDLVGHNLLFDIDVMRIRGFDLGNTKRKYYDTLSIAKSILKAPSKPWNFDETIHSVPDFKLGSLLSFHDIDQGNAHRALADAMAAGFLFYGLYDDYLLKAKYGIKGKI